MRATKKTSKKKHSWKNDFYLLGRQKTHVFFGSALPKSNARAHLKQRKKPSGQTLSQHTIEKLLKSETKRIWIKHLEKLDVTV